jgi:hypothetical protein
MLAGAAFHWERLRTVPAVQQHGGTDSGKHSLDYAEQSRVAGETVAMTLAPSAALEKRHPQSTQLIARSATPDPGDIAGNEEIRCQAIPSKFIDKHFPDQPETSYKHKAMVKNMGKEIRVELTVLAGFCAFPAARAIRTRRSRCAPHGSL